LINLNAKPLGRDAPPRGGRPALLPSAGTARADHLMVFVGRSQLNTTATTGSVCGPARWRPRRVRVRLDYGAASRAEMASARANPSFVGVFRLAIRQRLPIFVLVICFRYLSSRVSGKTCAPPFRCRAGEVLNARPARISI
jgi:hypothetical protein